MNELEHARRMKSTEFITAAARSGESLAGAVIDTMILATQQERAKTMQRALGQTGITDLSSDPDWVLINQVFRGSNE